MGRLIFISSGNTQLDIVRLRKINSDYYKMNLIILLSFSALVLIMVVSLIIACLF